MNYVLFLYAAGITGAPCDVINLDPHAIRFECQNVIASYTPNIPPHGPEDWTVIVNDVTYRQCGLAVSSENLYAFVCDKIFSDGFEREGLCF